MRKEKMLPVYTLEEIVEMFRLSEIGETIIAIRDSIKKAIETGKKQSLVIEGEEYQVDSEANVYDEGSNEPILNLGYLIKDLQ